MLRELSFIPQRYLSLPPLPPTHAWARHQTCPPPCHPCCGPLGSHAQFTSNLGVTSLKSVFKVVESSLGHPGFREFGHPSTLRIVNYLVTSDFLLSFTSSSHPATTPLINHSPKWKEGDKPVPLASFFRNHGVKVSGKLDETKGSNDIEWKNYLSQIIFPPLCLGKIQISWLFVTSRKDPTDGMTPLPNFLSKIRTLGYYENEGTTSSTTYSRWSEGTRAVPECLSTTLGMGWGG